MQLSVRNVLAVAYTMVKPTPKPPYPGKLSKNYILTNLFPVIPEQHAQTKT